MVYLPRASFSSPDDDECPRLHQKMVVDTHSMELWQVIPDTQGSYSSGNGVGHVHGDLGAMHNCCEVKRAG